MRVYLDVDGEKHLVGRTDLSDTQGPVYEVRLFGQASLIKESFTIGAVTHLPKDGHQPVVETAVIVTRGQIVELLPGWQPLAS